MAVEIITRKWCDVHMQSDEKIDAETITVAFSNRKPREVDLCEECIDVYVEPLRALVGEEGRKTDAEAPKPVVVRNDGGNAVHDCPVGCGYRGNRSNMRSHIVGNHDTTLAKEETRLGHSLDGRELKYFCKYKGCGCGFTRPQGLSSHIRQEGHEDQED